MMATHIKRNEDRDGEVAEGAVAFTLTKPVDPRLLDDELSAKMNWRKDGGIVIEGMPATASEAEPVTVWVLREDVDAKALQSAVGAHAAPDPADAEDWATLRAALTAKVDAGEPLDAEEIQQALRLILRGA